MRHFYFLFGLILSFFFSPLSNATLVEADVFRDGSNKGFSLDEPDYNLEWLDFGITNNMTVKAAIELTKTSELYQGFRVAGFSEVDYLWRTLFYNTADFYSTEDYITDYGYEVYVFHEGDVNQKWAEYIPTIGVNVSTTPRNGISSYFSHGIFLDDNSSSALYSPALYQYKSALVSGVTGKAENVRIYGSDYAHLSLNQYDPFYSSRYFEQTSREETSIFMVRTISVSEPDLFILMSFLIGIFITVKKNKFIVPKQTTFEV